MKKIFSLMFIMACVALTANAQKGSFYLGTSGISVGENSDFSPMTGFMTGSYEHDNGTGKVKTNYSAWGLAPEVGYFVSDNIAVGLGLYYKSISQETDKSSPSDKVAKNIFGVNPYARYYFLTKGAFRMYGQAGLTYASGKADIDGAKAENFLEAGIKPGISYNLSDRFAINATFGNLGYASYEDKNYNEKDSGFGLNLNMSSLAFGLSVSF